jgi:hypothetical protein
MFAEHLENNSKFKQYMYTLDFHSKIKDFPVHSSIYALATNHILKTSTITMVKLLHYAYIHDASRWNTVQ